MVGSVRSKNEEMGVFKCEICGIVFNKRENLFSHLADVHRTFCFVCKWIFESEPDLIIHNLVSHDTSFYICGREKCLLQFKSEDELGAHLEEKHENFMQKISPKQNQSCELCGVKFAKAKSLLKHKINHHKVGNVYICNQCQFCSDSVDGLMEHERREQGHNHPALTLPSTKPHVILHGKPIIPCNKCKTKFRLGTDLIQHMRLKHRDVINNKGAGEWKCGECKKEFKQEISLNHHFIAKHKPRKELEVVKEEEAMLEIEIKIEIKSEPRDQNEYYENLLEMTDLKTEAICNNDKEIEPELTLEETLEEPVYYLADTDYNIKKEDSALEEADYNIKVEESDEQMVVKDLKKEISEVINQMSNDEVKEVEAGQDIKSGMIRVHLPADFHNMQDDFIKEFFEASYGKIIKFDRCRKVPRAQKQKGFRTRSFCWITFEDEKASKFLDKQGHVILDGCKLKTVAYEHSKEMKTLRPPQSGTYDILMQKTGTSHQSNSLLLDLQVGTSKPKQESDNDSISSMQGECDSCILCKSKRHAENLQVSKSRTMRKVKGRSKKKNKKTKHPTMAQLPAQPIKSLNSSQHQVIPDRQVAARPPPQFAARRCPQVAARLPLQVPARPPTQVTARPPLQAPARPPPRVPARPPPWVPARPPPRVPARPPPRVPARPPLQVPARPPPQVPARPPPRVPARPPPQVPAMPPPQYPVMPPTSYYGYQNQPYGWSWGQAGHGYYPAEFESAHWSGDRTLLGRPYCYYDDAGKLVQRRGVNARMRPY